MAESQMSNRLDKECTAYGALAIISHQRECTNLGPYVGIWYEPVGFSENTLSASRPVRRDFLSWSLIIMKGRPYSSNARVPKVDIVNGETHTAQKKLFLLLFSEDYIQPRLCAPRRRLLEESRGGARRTKPNPFRQRGHTYYYVFFSFDPRSDNELLKYYNKRWTKGIQQRIIHTFQKIKSLMQMVCSTIARSYLFSHQQQHLSIASGSTAMLSYLWREGRSLLFKKGWFSVSLLCCISVV